MLLKTLDGQKPIIIAHRGASGLRPEHTLASFLLALEQGADFIETDVVMTKDGVPIIRHEPLLNHTTNIFSHLEHSDCAPRTAKGNRQTTKVIDGVKITGFFAEDFTLQEIKTLRARQPIAERSQEFDDLWSIPTLAEVIELVKDFRATTGKAVGIVTELKHSSYFNSIGLNVEEAVVKVLVESDFTNREQNIIQTFEIAPLVRLQQEIMPNAGINLVLHQLVSPNFAAPYDVVANFNDSSLTSKELRKIYGDLLELNDRLWRYAEHNRDIVTNFKDLRSKPKFYQFVSTYAEAINPWKNSILLAKSLVEPDGLITSQLTGKIFPLIELAHQASLKVNPYTLRNELPYLSLNTNGMVQTPEAEAEKLIQLGVDGLIGDYPQTLKQVCDKLTR